MKEFKKRVKKSLLFQLVKSKEQIKYYQKLLDLYYEREKKYIDKFDLMQDDIRQLLLKLNEHDRGEWLKEKGKEYERYFAKKKRINEKVKANKINKVFTRHQKK